MPQPLRAGAMTSTGGMRKRVGGGGAAGTGTSSMYAENEVVLDDEEDKPLVGGAPLPAAGHGDAADYFERVEPPHHRAPRATAASGTVSNHVVPLKVKVGLVVEKLREIDLADVYRYWSVFSKVLSLITFCSEYTGTNAFRNCVRSVFQSWLVGAVAFVS